MSESEADVSQLCVKLSSSGRTTRIASASASSAISKIYSQKKRTRLVNNIDVKPIAQSTPSRAKRHEKDSEAQSKFNQDLEFRQSCSNQFSNMNTNEGSKKLNGEHSRNSPTKEEGDKSEIHMDQNLIQLHSLHCDANKGWKPYEPSIHPPDREEQEINKLFDELANWTSSETKKLSHRLGHMETHASWATQKIQEHEALVSNMRNDFEAQKESKRVMASAMTELQALIESNSAKIEQVEIDHALLKSAFDQRCIDIENKMADEKLENIRGITLTKQIAEKLSQRCDRLERRGVGGSSCNNERTLPPRVDIMMSHKIVFTFSDRHHPHRFINRFENYIASVDLIPEHKCTLFRGLITMPSAKEWLELQDEETDYERLKRKFLYEFWDPSSQRAALKYFREHYRDAGNTRTMAMGFLKWGKTLQRMDEVTPAMQVQIMYEKLPTELKAMITSEDKKDLNKFMERINEFTEIREDPEINQVVVIGRKNPHEKPMFKNDRHNADKESKYQKDQWRNKNNEKRPEKYQKKDKKIDEEKKPFKKSEAKDSEKKYEKPMSFKYTETKEESKSTPPASPEKFNKNSSSSSDSEGSSESENDSC